MIKTGWPPGLLQDDDRKLAEWFASRVDARWVVRKVCNEIRKAKMLRDDPKVHVKIAVAVSEAGTVKLAWANSNWIQEDRKHKAMLEEIRSDKQLWSLRYVDVNVAYPVSHEKLGD